MKLRSKIFWAMFITGFILTISGVFTHSLFFRINMQDQINQNIRLLAEARSNGIEFYFEDLNNALEVIYTSDIYEEVLTSEDNEDLLTDIYDDFERLMLVEDEIFKITLIDSDANVIASSDESSLDSSREDVIGSLLNNDIYFVDVHISNFTGEPGMDFAYAIRDEDENLIGAIMIDVALDYVYSMMTDTTGLGETGEVYLINSEQYLISPSRFVDDAILSIKADHDNAANCLAMQLSPYSHLGHDPVSIYTNYSDDLVLGSHAYIPDTGWCLITELQQEEAFAVIRRDLMVGLLLILSIMGSVGLIALSLGRSISKPIDKLRDGTERIRQGDLDYKVGTDSKDEVGQLSRAFDDMTEAIKDSMSQVDSKVKKQTNALDEQRKELEQQQRAVLNVLDDVNAEKERSQKLASDLEKFELAVEGASDHIVITDPEGIVLYANKGVEQITGFNRKDILGKKAGIKDNWGGLENEDFYATLWDTIKNKKQTFEGEVKNKRSNGQEYFAEVKISPILDETGEAIFFVGIERDITRAKDVDRMKTEFISLASHQLRTPLSGMKWFLHMLLDGDAGDLNPEQKRFIEKVLGSNERMIGLVKALLNISRIESGRIIIDPEPSDLGELINQVIQDEQPEIKTRKHKVEVDIQDDLQDMNVDPKLTREIYSTLITNAINYTPDGGEIKISVYLEGDKVISKVSDNGYGIPKDEQSNIFEKFFRASNITNVVADGNGLGMYLVKAIVDSSDGEIWFESKEGEGTTFWFSLPKEGVKSQEGEVRINQ